MVMPGDNVNLDVELITPVALERGSLLRDSRGWADGWRRDASPKSLSNPAPNSVGLGRVLVSPLAIDVLSA